MNKGPEVCFHLLPMPGEGGSWNSERPEALSPPLLPLFLPSLSPPHRVAFHCGKQSEDKLDLVDPS